MSDCYLTERQKEMMQTLIPGLKRGTLGLEISLVFGDDDIVGVFNFGGEDKLPQEFSNDVSMNDFHAFESCGLIQRTANNGYKLHVGRIITYVENGFKFPDAAPTSVHYTTNIQSNSGIVNINTTLQNTRQAVQNNTSLPDESKDELEQLLKQLEDELQKVPAEYQEDADAVAVKAEDLVEKANTGNRKLLEIDGEGLQKAATNLAKVAPTVIPIAVQIVQAILR